MITHIHSQATKDFIRGSCKHSFSEPAIVYPTWKLKLHTELSLASINAFKGLAFTDN